MLFDRTASLIIGKPGGGATLFGGAGSVQVVNGEAVSRAGFKIRFEITKDVLASPNLAKISIHNLSAATRAKIKEYQDHVALSAGYVGEGGAQLLFTGQLYIATHLVQQPEVVTKLESGDGFGSFRETRMALSVSPGAAVGGAIQQIAQAMGLPIKGGVPATSAQFPNGYAAVGAAQEHLRAAAAAANFEVSTQDGAIVLVPRYTTTSEPAILVSQQTGMLGSPQRCVEGSERLLGLQPLIRWKVKSLLNPRIQPYRRVQLVGREVNTVLRVQSVKHTGDTWGDEWFTEMELCSTLIGGFGGASPASGAAE